MKKFIFHTKDYGYLAKKIMEEIYPNNKDISIGKMEVKDFPDGETYHNILSDVRGADIYLLGGTIDDKATLEIFDLGFGLVKRGANSLTLIVPFLGYSTMERAKPNTGEIAKAKTRAVLLSHIPHGNIRNRIFMIDLHAEGIPSYFEGSILAEHLYAKDFIINTCKKIVRIEGDESLRKLHNAFVFGSTDAGRAKWIESLSKDMGVECALIIKRRISGTETQVVSLSAEVKDKIVIIYDDMIRTGGTLIKAAKTYKDAGAKLVYAIATHGVLPGTSLNAKIDEDEKVIYIESHNISVEDSIDKLVNCGDIEHLFITDTHPSANTAAYKFPNFVSIASVASLIAENTYFQDIKH